MLAKGKGSRLTPLGPAKPLNSVLVLPSGLQALRAGRGTESSRRFGGPDFLDLNEKLIGDLSSC